MVTTRRGWLQLSGLWAIVVVQPLLELVGASPEFFVAHRAGAADVLLLTVVLCAAGPLALSGLVALSGLAGEPARRVTLCTALGALVALLGLQMAVRAGVATWPAAVALAAVVAAAGVVAYRAWAPVRSALSVLSLAALAVPAIFLARPGIATVVFGAAPGPHAPRPGNGGDDARTETPVVFVVFDELPLVSLLDRDRNLDAQLYPNLAALARDGVWFRNATTVDDFTKYALPAMLTGRYPERIALPSAADYPDTIFSLLAGSHRLEVAEAVTALCPPSVCAGAGGSTASRLAAMMRDLRVVFLHLVLTSDLTGNLADPSTGWANFGDVEDVDSAGDDGADAGGESLSDAVQERWQRGIGAARVAPVREFIDGIGADDPQPTFYFLHTLISHQPHRMLPTGKENGTWARLPGRRGWNRDHPWTVAQHYQRHLLQVGFVDRLVGRLVDRLRASGLYDRALVVITSDHGISHLPNARQRHFSTRTAAEIMRVPLIIKWPRGVGRTGEISDANVESIDIVPTVAGALGLQLPWRVDGVSLLDREQGPRRTKRMFAGDGRRRHELPAAGPDMTPALDRKLALFGDHGRNPHRAPRAGDLDWLIGRPVDELVVADDGPAGEVIDARQFEHVDTASTAMPFDVSGRFASPLPGAAVAVAVNGVVRAVTRTWEANPRGWLATPGFDAWRQGRNAVEVFVTEGDGSRLRRVTLGDVRPDDLNLISESAAREWGIVQGGFHATERSSTGIPFRWTRDRAALAEVLSHQTPRAVLVEVLHVPGDRPKPLRVEANDCVLFDGAVRGGWTAELPLEPCRFADRGLTLRFTTPAPPAGRDRRRLGVALSRVLLR